MKEVATATNDKSTSTAVVVTNMRDTMSNYRLMLMFRQFLRSKIDNNKSEDPVKKKTSEQWLDFVTICEKVFELPEDETEQKVNFMVEIGEKFLGRSPDGYNMALLNQLNRKELICHCNNLSKYYYSSEFSKLHFFSTHLNVHWVYCITALYMHHHSCV